MEELSSRRSSSDEYGSFNLIETSSSTVHDVMSLEMSHHGSYLDPRSFGGGETAFADEFVGNSGQMENQYEAATNGYEQPPVQQHQQQRSQQYSSSHGHQPLPPPGSRFDHHATHPPMRHGVPTYPVKTLDPSTCAPYAPIRMTHVKPPRIRHNARSQQKKEPMDPKTVEDEVARNVSQILSATKQQKLAQEAQARCGIYPTVQRINFSCSDCGKSMTSHRNLQRHRQTSCCRKVGEWVDKSQAWPEWLDKDRMSEDSDSLPGIGGQSLAQSSFSSEGSGWCSPNHSYSPSAIGSVDMANMLPLSLDTDDSQTHSSSDSHCSNSSNGKGAQESYMCEACHKTVCSMRSLRRHQGTCKQYLSDYGLAPDTDVVPVKQRNSARRVVKAPTYLEEDSSTSGSASPELGDDTYQPPVRLRVPADSTQSEADRPKIMLAVNTCTDCNRQLCSASNLKRHRATCKMALSKEGDPELPPAPPPSTLSSNLPELPERDRSIIDRSYAEAVAASNHIRQQARAAAGGAPVVETAPPPPPPPPAPTSQQERPRQQYAAYIVTSPRTGQKPWVTVGEHLRAKHVQQKMTEGGVPKDEPQGAMLIQNIPPPGAPAHNQIVEIRRPSLMEKEEKPLVHREAPLYKAPAPMLMDPVPPPPPPPPPAVATEQARPTHVTVVKSSEAMEIPPLESIITTQPLSGDRVTGVPVLVHDSRGGQPSKITLPTAEFQCPECKKTYSCRKNVKRHRMAVHKLTNEDITRYPGPAPCPHAHIGESSQLSPSLPRILLPPRVDAKAEFKTETIPLSPTILDKGFSQDASAWHQPPLDYIEEEERKELKRGCSDSLCLDDFEEKKSRPELAEADSTFNEDREFGTSSSHHSSPGVVTSTGPLPSLASWMSSRPLSVEIPYGGTRSAGHSPLYKSRRFDSDMSNPFLPQKDNTVPLDPMLGHGHSASSRCIDEEGWYSKRSDEMPDSTTTIQCQRLDRSTSPVNLMDADTPQLGGLPYTRKRALSGGSSSSNTSPATFINDPKQARHLCQDCGKFYSSEWNLERHRRESCPTKMNPEAVSPNPVVSDEVSIIIGSCRFVLPRSALTKASSAFTSLFSIHDPAKGELRLEGDPMDFQNLLDVYNDPINLSPANVEAVLALAEQYKFTQVTDTCAKFICDELSNWSLMHAIRLADTYKLLTVKQRLFSSISIEVFRSLNSDRDYQMMTSELKAELLEKWGTFL